MEDEQATCEENGQRGGCTKEKAEGARHDDRATRWTNEDTCRGYEECSPKYRDGNVFARKHECSAENGATADGGKWEHAADTPTKTDTHHEKAQGARGQAPHRHSLAIGTTWKASAGRQCPQ